MSVPLSFWRVGYEVAMRYSVALAASRAACEPGRGTDNVKPAATEGIASRGSTRTGCVSTITASAPSAIAAPAPITAKRRIHRIELYVESVKELLLSWLRRSAEADTLAPPSVVRYPGRPDAKPRNRRRPSNRRHTGPLAAVLRAVDRRGAGGCRVLRFGVPHHLGTQRLAPQRESRKVMTASTRR